jgi:hypothetical protein
MSYRYRAEVLDALAAHGIRPTPGTPPEKAHEVLNDLYRYELRRLRDGLLKRDIAKPDYYGRVLDVRRRYALLSRRLWEWTE